MAMALKLDPAEELARTPASDVKKLGWRGVMKSVSRAGRVVVTNHNQPQAVILSIEEYDTLMHALRAADAHSEAALDQLRHRFDERLESLQSRGAGERLRAVMRGPATLKGKVKAGATY